MTKNEKCIELIALYGSSGNGKTTQVGEMARWVYEKIGKKTRLVSASLGGWGSVQWLIDDGIIIPYWMRNKSHPLALMEYLTRGWWPEDVDADPWKLVAPADQAGWDDIGLIAFESVAEIAEHIMVWATQQEAKGHIQISTRDMCAKFHDLDVAFSSPSDSSYGAIQNFMTQFVANSKSMLGKYVLWTSLDLKTIDKERTRLPMYGIDVIGTAKTPRAGAWFDHVIHCDMMPSAGKPAMRRLYLRTHFAPDGIPYVGKVTTSIFAPLPEYLEGENCTLRKFMDLLVESRTKRLKPGGSKDVQPKSIGPIQRPSN